MKYKIISALLAGALLGYVGNDVIHGYERNQLPIESDMTTVHTYNSSRMGESGLAEQPVHPENQPQPAKKMDVIQDDPEQSVSPDQPIQQSQLNQQNQPVQQSQPVQHGHPVQHIQPIQHNKLTQLKTDQDKKIKLAKVAKKEQGPQLVTPEKHHKHKHHNEHKKGKNNQSKGQQNKALEHQKKKNNNHNNKPKKQKQEQKKKLNIKASLEIIDESELNKTEKNILDYLIIYVEKPVEHIVNRLQDLSDNLREAEQK